MKKTYQKPETTVITLMQQVSILGLSDEPASVKRRVGYEVSDLYKDAAVYNTDKGKVLPNEIWELSTFSGDPFGEHGQGTNGTGTRAGGFDLWED